MKSRDSANNSAALWILCIILAVAYILPWLSSHSTALTLGAFDLSEWTSLHPSVVNSSPALIVPLLLRLIPVLIVLIITVNTIPSPKRAVWWITALIMICVAIALFPPLEFLTSERGNINYRQMFAISGGVLLMGGIGLSGILYRYRIWLTIITASVGMICTLFAISQAYQLYADFYLPRTIGIGAILTALTFLIIIVRTVWQWNTNRQ